MEDVDGDGKVDIVATSALNANIVLMLGNGDGTFKTVSGTSLKAVPNIPALADVDGDGRADLIAVEASLSQVEIRLSLGAGGFASSGGILTGFGSSMPLVVAAADVNSDGRRDLIVSGSTLFTLLGTGGGSFASPVKVGAGGGALALGDVNGDGKMDLVANGNNNLLYYLNLGGGSFQQAAFVSGATPVALAAGDLNNDGKVDIAAVLATGSMVVASYLGSANGLGPPGRMVQPPYPLPYGFTLADFDGDGVLDVVVSTPKVASFAILLGKGDGSFASGTTIAVSRSFGYITAADLNGDHRPDLIAACGGGIVIELNATK